MNRPRRTSLFRTVDPRRPAPVLITEEVVERMRAGSVIVDLAAANGGNCPLTEATVW